MYKFKKILVGLDLTFMDEELIDAACSICKTSGSKDVYFFNVIRDLSFPDSIIKEFPDIREKTIKEREDQIAQSVNGRFECEGVNIHFVIKEGQVTKELMKFTAENKVDLVVLGRKNDRKGGGITISRVARRVGCSMLAIPKGVKLDLEKILVPIDFSSYSKMALEKAIEFSVNYEKPVKIIAQNVFQVPVGYHYTGKSYDEFAEVMKTHAEKDYIKFSSDLDAEDSNIETIYTLDKEENVIGHIYSESVKRKVSLIMIGAKGRTATTAIFIGSKAERLIQLDSEIPILVIRPKGKRAGFREYIQDL
jgi:nucleotide-binding universal stress UspA family protein